LNLATPDPHEPADYTLIKVPVAATAIPYLGCLRSLQQLQLTFLCEPDTHMLSSLTALTKLVLDSCLCYVPDSALDFITSLSSLRDLSLNTGDSFSLDFFSGLTALSNLSSLDLRVSSMVEEEEDMEGGLSVLTSLPSLQHFTYIGPAFLIRQQLPLLTNLKNLHWGNGAYWYQGGISTLEDVIPPAALAPLTGLTSLA
jgi:hypothetical protein